ncbi:hypothetical protein N9M16_04430 [Candidatus Dependentiae bacterium]|nr:hypothetical protein [Candidatus Dependentiae bacterium]
MSIKVVKRTERPLGRARDGTGEPHGGAVRKMFIFSPPRKILASNQQRCSYDLVAKKAGGRESWPGVTPGPETRRGAARDPRRAGLARIERAYGYWRLT